ncbi:hypothetical protein DFR52_106235 [Hoeflea marina]|uniref:Uncharacterized protein n=1 Tax=Hoeflea marina TaxID=274592 RepID=A0A317PE94_9HYPH|nr:hypothetical protein [Hoeflea marina]PWV97710.1 hypothetical protein DFR52_106235 [Hoeflea marina]
MIEAKTLSGLILDNRIEAVKTAIVQTITSHLSGVTVLSHPGKLDISDVVENDIVKAPGIAIGWTRIRAVEDVSASHGLMVEFAAYIVVEDLADIGLKRRVDREVVGHAIGGFLLQLLGDEDAASWGLTYIGLPLTTPPAEFRPLFTARSFARGMAYYVVTWTQTVFEHGASPFSTETPQVSETEDEQVLFDDGIPDEIRALIERDQS